MSIIQSSSPYPLRLRLLFAALTLLTLLSGCASSVLPWSEATALAERPTLPSGDLMSPRRDMAPCIASDGAQAAISHLAASPPPKASPPASAARKASKAAVSRRSVASDDDRVAVLSEAIVCLAEVGGVNGLKVDGLQAWARDVTKPPPKSH